MANLTGITPVNQLTKENKGYKVSVKGNKIRVALDKDAITYFEATFKEGRFLYLSRFTVIDSKDDYIKFINNSYKIIIYKICNVQKCPEFEIETDIYRVVSYEQVNEKLLQDDEIFDVTERVVNVIRYRTIKDRHGLRKILEFQLQNHMGELIRCALWGEHTIRLVAMEKKYHLDDKPIVALIHNCNLKDWDDGPQVNNIFFGTRLYLTETVPPFSIYTTLLENNPNRAELSQIPTMDPNIEEEETSVLRRFETTSPTWISDIVNLPKDVNFVVHAKVKRLFNNEGWFQQLCWKCEQKHVDTYIVELEKAILWCEKCAAEMQ
ncbi:uncharacterized protein [Rutidosis leptorrhynchoides]|uniref:uncharacterized protein n=1 Tax=Rutidosis leptorrhynchoides TaxID=125765 RepID=UPI003A995C68